MIKTKFDLKEYLQSDAIASRRRTVKASFMGDEVWKFQRCLRYYEYYSNQSGLRRYLNFPMRIYYRFVFHVRSVYLNFSIPINCFDKGLSIAHYGTIVVNNAAKIGKNCRIQEGVNIGATNGSSKSANIGNNVFIGTGAKIIGDVTIADDVAIGANAVVIKSIEESGTTWAGVPAKKISNNNSHSNLAPQLFNRV